MKFTLGLAVLSMLVAVYYACPADYSVTPDPSCDTSTLTCVEDSQCDHGFQCCFGPNNACQASCYHPDHGHHPGSNNHPGGQTGGGHHTG